MSQRMEYIELDEVGKGKECALSWQAAEALRSTKFVKLERLREGRWLVKPADKVGIFTAAGIDVHIKPKLPIRRLFFMMGYSLNPQDWRWRDEDLLVAEEADLVTTIAYFFERHVNRALRRGVLGGYRRIDASLPVMRGRLRRADQLRKRHGQSALLEVTYDEFSHDIAENQILLAATNRLLNLPRITIAISQRLRRIREQFAGVRRLGANEPIPQWQPSRNNRRFHQALVLADSVLRACSAEMGHADIPVSGFLVTMHRIFEDFVCVALREALNRRQLNAISLQEDLHMDEGGIVPIRPDMVWWHDWPGDAIAVVDAKYYLQLNNDHLKQMLTYCTVLGAKRGHLVYAR